MTVAQPEKELYANLPYGNLPPDRLRVLVVAGKGENAADGHSTSPWRLAAALAACHDVVLAVPVLSEESDRSFAVIYYNLRNIELLAGDSDAVVVGRSTAASVPRLLSLGPVSAAHADSLMEGDLQRGREVEPPADIAKSLQPGELFVIRPLPRRPERPGLSHYLARLRFHLGNGGPRVAAAKAAQLLKRKISRGQ